MTNIYTNILFSSGMRGRLKGSGRGQIKTIVVIVIIILIMVDIYKVINSDNNSSGNNDFNNNNNKNNYNNGNIDQLLITRYYKALIPLMAMA